MKNNSIISSFLTGIHSPKRLVSCCCLVPKTQNCHGSRKCQIMSTPPTRTFPRIMSVLRVSVSPLGCSSQIPQPMLIIYHSVLLLQYFIPKCIVTAHTSSCGDYVLLDLLNTLSDRSETYLTPFFSSLGLMNIKFSK